MLSTRIRHNLWVELCLHLYVCIFVGIRVIKTGDLSGLMTQG